MAWSLQGNKKVLHGNRVFVLR